MAVTSGFFNSLDHDRKYDATQFGSLFDGLILDGVYETVGNQFIVEAATGMDITVGTGRCWFDHTWLYNDAAYPITIDPAETLYNRYDAIVIEVNNTSTVRENTIKCISGSPATTPVKPTLTDTNTVHQYPLAYIYVGKGVTEITQSVIENMVGTSDCPFVTGLIQKMNIDALIAQWNAQWQEYMVKSMQTQSDWSAEQQELFKSWANEQEAEFISWSTAQQTGMENFRSTSESDFETWFDGIKGQLSTDAAGNLQNEVDSNAQTDFNRYYSLVNKTTRITKDSSGNIESITETADDAVAVTKFETTDDGKTITTIVTPVSGSYKYTKVTTIAADDSGSTIDEKYTRSAK